jgi:glycosyltransferase involved in cell wall biosynthesis
MKKILFITPYGFNDRLRYFTEFVLARQLARQDWEVYACTFWKGEAQPRAVVDGIFVCRVRRRKTALPTLVWLMNKRPDVVHIFHLRNALGLMAFLLARCFSIPVIFSEYGLLHNPYLVEDRDNPLDYPLKIANVVTSFRRVFHHCSTFRNLPQRLASYLFHLPMVKANKVVLLSKHNLAIAREIGLNNAVWMPYAVDGRRFQEVEPGALSDKGIEDLLQQRYALFVGQMKLRKGWDVLMRAIPYIDGSLVSKFVFVSPTSVQEPPSFYRLTNEVGVQNRVMYIGRASNQTLKELYRAASVVVIPSRYEGFGLPILEAFEMGKPVVASDVVAINEVVKHGYNGYLLPPNDPHGLAIGISTVLRDDALRSHLVRGGRETLEAYHIENRIHTWMGLYQEVVASKRTR